MTFYKYSTLNNCWTREITENYKNPNVGKNPTPVRRMDVRDWVKEWATSRKVSHHVGVVGENGENGRQNVQPEYVDMLARSKIVVTCEPDKWEGDYRTQEAIAAGAITFVNKHMRRPPNVSPSREFATKHELFAKLDALGDPAEGDLIAPLRAREVFAEILRGRRVHVIKPSPQNRIGEYQNLMLPGIAEAAVEPADADAFIVDVHRSGDSTEDYRKLATRWPGRALIIVDWSDGQDAKSEWLELADEYWKRSLVHRTTQQLATVAEHPKVHQLFYSVKPKFEEALESRQRAFADRDIHIACFL